MRASMGIWEEHEGIDGGVPQEGHKLGAPGSSLSASIHPQPGASLGEEVEITPLQGGQEQKLDSI